MDLIINKEIKNNEKLRESFFALAIQTFDLSFKAWYQDGYWTDKYTPYAILDGEKVVANASANIIDTIWNGQAKRYIQLGTIMSDIAYRNKGLARQLINEILSGWLNKCDAIYLFANDSVLDFYPKWGFIKASEYQCMMPITPKPKEIKKLTMSNEHDRDFLKKYYAKSNPFSALPMLNNYGLLMFYCSAFMKDCVFYCKALDAVVIAMQDNENLICYDIYCDEFKSLNAILSAIANEETKRVIFGFTPKNTANCTINTIVNEDETLFILKGKDNIFAQNKIMFPSISHA